MLVNLVSPDGDSKVAIEVSRSDAEVFGVGGDYKTPVLMPIMSLLRQNFIRSVEPVEWDGSMEDANRIANEIDELNGIRSDKVEGFHRKSSIVHTQPVSPVNNNRRVTKEITYNEDGLPSHIEELHENV